jgi:hypothetical protein
MYIANPHSRINPSYRLAIYLLAVPFLVGVMALATVGQDADKAAGTAPKVAYLEDTPDYKLQNYKVDMKKPNFAPGEQEPFDNFLNKYEFPRWTVIKDLDKNFGARAPLKKSLNGYFNQAKSGPMRDRLNALLLEYMSKRVKQNYHPVFRVNAMLAIGELNKNAGGPGVDLIPLPEALPVLLDNIKDAKQLDAVKIAALLGIKHQVANKVRNAEIADLAFKLASSADKDVGKAWMRAQGIEILGLLGSPGDGNKVVALLQSIIEDKKASPKLRCAAAEALGQINLSGAAGLDADKLISSLVQLMQNGADAELKNAKEDDTEPFRRGIKSYLAATMAGLSDSQKSMGVITAPNANNKKITDNQKALRELLAAFDKEDASYEDLKKAVETAKTKLE